MILGVILAGSAIGAVAAVTALILGQGVWMALLIYSGTGVLGVLAVAALMALRRDDAPQPAARRRPAPRVQRG